jgi:hypothetical protein
VIDISVKFIDFRSYATLSASTFEVESPSQFECLLPSASVVDDPVVRLLQYDLGTNLEGSPTPSFELIRWVSENNMRSPKRRMLLYVSSAAITKVVGV